MVEGGRRYWDWRLGDGLKYILLALKYRTRPYSTVYQQLIPSPLGVLDEPDFCAQMRYAGRVCCRSSSL